ncbi:S-layer homology domain-containing protein [Clostridiaceae bacterium M8S5]|nr:S-layer homology domain-containing protein [Clostridiaceae bacterium M8S5]
MKKVLSLVLALSLVLGLFSMAFAATPKDIVGTEYEKAIERLMAFGVVTGDPNGNIRPNDQITRAEFTAMVVRAIGMGATANMQKGATKFIDVPSNHWASGYINIGTGMLINGLGDGKFDPEGKLTYAHAATLLVRALGYTDKGLGGTWPNNYLFKANELGLTKNINMTDFSTEAKRGTVFKMLDNALEKDSVTMNTVGVYIQVENSSMLDKMQTNSYVGRVTDITPSKNKITVKGDKTTNRVKVAEDFDFEAVYGLNVKVWCDKNDKIIAYKALEEPILSAVKATYENGAKIKLMDNSRYSVKSDAKIFVNGEAKDRNQLATSGYDYAKIVLNDDDEVVFFDAHTLHSFVVEKVNEDAESLECYEDSLKVKDFTIVKDGKTISIEDIEDGDIVFFNKTDKYAMVYDKTVEGKIQKVYTTSFKIDDKTYNIAGQYKADDRLDTLDDEALEAMRAEGDVTVHLSPKSEVVYVEGKLGDLIKSTFYAVVKSNSRSWNNRGIPSHTLDVVKADGENKTYDLADSFINHKNNSSQYDKVVGITDAGTIGDLTDDFRTTITKGKVVKLTVDSDGYITKVEYVTHYGNVLSSSNVVRSNSTYANGLLLKNNTVVFNTTNPNKYKATTWGEIKDDFERVTGGKVYEDRGRVGAFIIQQTNQSTEVDKHYGLITSSSKRYNKNIWDIEIEVDGQKYEYQTEEGTWTSNPVTRGTFAELHTRKGTEIVTAIPSIANRVISNFTIANLRAGAKTFTNGTAGSEYELTRTGKVYNKNNEIIDIRDLNDNDIVTVYKVEGNNRFVQYIVKGNSSSSGGGNIGNASITYVGKDGANHVFEATVPSTGGPFVMKLVTDSKTETKALDTNRRVTFDDLTAGNVYTATLYRLNDPNTTLATLRFIASAGVVTNRNITGISAVSNVNVAYDTTQANALASLPANATATVTGNRTVSVPMTWTLASGVTYSATTPGTYAVVGTPTTASLPTGVTNTNNVTVTANLVVQQNGDASLSDLQVGGTTVTGFNTNTLNYTVKKPSTENANTVPAVTATATVAGATTVTITPAANLDGTTTVIVRATNGATKTYTVKFVHNDKPAVANPIADRTVNAADGNVVIPLANVFTDAENDSLTYTVTSTATGTATANYVVSNGQLIITPNAGASGGTVTINIVANDGLEDSAADSFILTIN